MIYLIAELTIAKGSLPKIIDEARVCIKATREEPGCIEYDFYQSQSNENKMVFVERWETREALDAHFTTSHLLRWRDVLTPHMEHRHIQVLTVDESNIHIM